MNESISLTRSTDWLRGWYGRALYQLCQSWALLGGVVLVALMVMSLVSIFGRKLFSAPVHGDIELMEMGAAVAIAAFLPLCEMRGHHIKVDAFTAWLPSVVNRYLDALAHLCCALAALILSWRTGLQMLDSREYGDVTTLLSVPLWIPLLMILPSLVLLAMAALLRSYLCVTDQQGRDEG
ncbi:TRAP transporter small permease [Pokkaliibacter sp. MBI-7]|uniref:TRAP transporter small permease n=1 Tax=Pokkaliibacter sp. MBI-7 TaxID=3040600 RepID=UPI0024489727|nr:TRAP transporter small permease [Pokkaliibacter sp. MBI-7]MDH2435924.1 TRAP transporter small permease [Pokkaliibacter sp. MBI-7]